jgi:hypothetical protein
MTKKCCDCNTEKELLEFNRNNRAKDGYLNRCKQCHNIYRRKQRLENPKKFREYERKLGQKHRERLNQRQRDYRKNNLEKVRQNERKRRENNPEKYREYIKSRKEYNAKLMRIYRSKNKDKQFARNQVMSALRCGKIIKGNCDICRCNYKVQAHHKDYSKPLEIVWLCYKHHLEVHNKKPLIIDK